MTRPVVAPLLLKPDEVAARLGISRDSVEALIASGDLATVDVGTGKRPRTRIREDHLAEFIERRTSAA